MPISRELGLPLKINRELAFGFLKLTGISGWSVINCDCQKWDWDWRKWVNLDLGFELKIRSNCDLRWGTPHQHHQQIARIRRHAPIT